MKESKRKRCNTQFLSYLFAKSFSCKCFPVIEVKVLIFKQLYGFPYRGSVFFNVPLLVVN